MEIVAPVIAFDRAGPELIVSIGGELDAATSPGLSAQITDHCRPEDEALWLDLSAVTFCASQGVSLIIRAHNEAIGRGGRAVVFHPSDPVMRILEMCNLIKGLNIRLI